jgi:glutamate dehydrogenase (NAD(P)+)
MDLPLTLKIKQQSGSCKDYPDRDVVTNTELLGLPVDVLIPSATEGKINGKSAESVKAKLVIEGANGRTTPEADRILAGNDSGSRIVK